MESGPKCIQSEPVLADFFFTFTANMFTKMWNCTSRRRSADSSANVSSLVRNADCSTSPRLSLAFKLVFVENVALLLVINPHVNDKATLTGQTLGGGSNWTLNIIFPNAKWIPNRPRRGNNISQKKKNS